MAIHLLITIVYSIACLLLGLTIIRVLGFRNKIEEHISPGALLVSGFLFGLGLLPQVWLGLGLLSVFSRPVVWSILIIAIGVGIFFNYRLIERIRKGASAVFAEVSRISLPWTVLLAFLCVLIINLGINSVILPPSGDAEAFYMVLPKIMASSERLSPQPNYSEFSQNGLLGEMHFAAIMLLADTCAAKFFVWFVALALTSLLILFCSETGMGSPGKIISLILLFSSSTFTFYITNGKVDIFGAALALGAYFWALKSRGSLSPFSLALTGLFAGFSFIAKLSNVPPLVPGLFLIILLNQFPVDTASAEAVKKSLFRFIKALAVIALFILFGMLPHLAKNQLLFGEPLAPFVFLHSSGLKWADQVWFSAENTRYILLTYPVALTFGLYPMQDGNISPLILALLPLWISYKKKNSFLQNKLFIVTAAAVIGVIVWMIARPSVMAPRYILATLLLFVPLAARGAERIMGKGAQYNLLKYSTYFALLFALMLVLFDQYPLKIQICQLPSGACSILLVISAILTVLASMSLNRMKEGRDALPFHFLCPFAALAIVWAMGKCPSSLRFYFLALLILIILSYAAGISRSIWERIHGVYGARLLNYMALGLFAVISFAQYSGISSEFRSGSFEKSLAYLNATARPGARVFFLGYYTYFMRTDLLQCMSRTEEVTEGYYTILYGWKLRNMILKYAPACGQEDLGLPDAQKDRLVHIFDWDSIFENGFTYICIQKNTHQVVYENLYFKHPPSWLKVNCLYDDASAVVYGIESADPARKPGFTCRQMHYPAWDVVRTGK